MKKKIISLVIIALLICAIAIPVSAATYSNTGSYAGSTGSCTYHTYAHCTTTYWNALIELTSSTDSYANYLFQTAVAPWPSDGFGSYTIEPYIYGASSTRIATNNNSSYILHAIEAKYMINNWHADYELVYAS